MKKSVPDTKDLIVAGLIFKKGRGAFRSLHVNGR